MTAAIFFHPEGYTTSGPKLMGRNAAGESFLRGFLAYNQGSALWAQVGKSAHAQLFVQTARDAGRNQPVKIVGRNTLATLSQPGTLYCPGPGIGVQAWQRAAYGHGRWSLCGITHTTASVGVMDSITDWISSPVQSWDAVICTSRAVRSNVECVLRAQADYLLQRLGVQRMIMPQLPVIPLGVHTGDFTFSAAQRNAARTTLGADDQTLIVLFVGRLSFHAKAHPLAVYQALQKAAGKLPDGHRILLVECGWHANDFIARAFKEAAQAACPDVRVVTLDGRKADDRQAAWTSADVFCSLSDNIQETFGIAPIEAMAAGLPVVVADWDGYKDTVRDGVDGFRIPTLMPQAGLGGDLALRHALGIDTYDRYCGNTCSLVAVDVDAAALAFSRLFASAELRRTMGNAGRKRAQEIYEWAKIIPQYEALWTQLAELRKAQAKNLPLLQHPWPARMDPFAAFAAYPTTTLTKETLLTLSAEDPVPLLKKLQGLAMINFAKDILPTEAELHTLLSLLAERPQTAGELVRDVPALREGVVLRALAWLAKLGIVSLSPHEAAV